MLAGLAMLLSTWLQWNTMYVFIIAFAIMIIIPTAYSFLLYKRGKDTDDKKEQHEAKDEMK